MKFNQFILDATKHNLTTIGSLSCSNTDMFINIVKQHIPNHKYYEIYDIVSLENISIKIKTENSDIIILNIVGGVSKYNLTNYIFSEIRSDDKKIILFFQTSIGFDNTYNIPRIISYKSDVVYHLDKYKLTCMKHRYMNPYFKTDVKEILRYYKIKTLLNKQI